MTKDSTSHSRLIDLNQYWQLFDFLGDKSALNASVGKEAAQKLRQSFELLRGVLVRDMQRTPEEFFELILAELRTESSPKQDDVCVRLLNHFNLKGF